MPRTIHTPGVPTPEPVEAAAPPPKFIRERGPVLTRSDYAEMDSREVDASTLIKPVLCRDGWVVPAPR